MSIFSYFKSLLNPNSKKDRKRRRTEVHPTDGTQFPKYRRVSSVFPKTYPAEDDDHFKKVKQQRHHYNEILENFLMEQQNQQRKQFEAVNADEEFSDDDEISAIRVPNISDQRSKPQPSGSGYQFKRQSIPDSFSFTQKSRQDPDVQFESRKQLSKPPLPELVPISRSIPVQNGLKPNGYGSYPPTQNRRSLLDFTNKNRAFNDSSSYNFKQSVLDRNHNLETKNRYDSLLKSLIPRFPLKASRQVSEALLQRNEPIPTVDLSSDETETSAGAAFGGETSRAPRFTAQYPPRAYEFKKPSAFVDLSDDDDNDNFFSVPPASSTIIQSKKSDSVRKSMELRRNESTTSIPEVKPVNSLAEKQQTRDCLKLDYLQLVYQRHKENRQKNDSQINDVSKTVSLLSLETHEHEKLQQKRIEDSLTTLKQAIVIDDEEEVVDEFPPLTDQQLHMIRFAMQGGSRNDVIVSKFNMNITRNDLLTLDALNWLNDEVINFYMELLKERSEQCEHLPKVHVMNTFFVPKLLQQGHSGVRRWTRKVDIFAYDIIPVPVHVGGVHWCMSIINIRDKTIRYYDSMGHPNIPVLEALKRYLHDESMDKKKVPYDTSDWTIENVRDCPQQRNGSDCGVFSCMFAEFISRDSKITFEQDHMQYFRRKMVFEIASGRLILGY